MNGRTIFHWTMIREAGYLSSVTSSLLTNHLQGDVVVLPDNDLDHSHLLSLVNHHKFLRNVKEIKKTWFQWFASKKFAYFLQANANCCIFTMLTSNKFLISIQNYLMAIFKHWNMHAGPKKKKKSVQPVVERRNFNLNLPFDGLAWKLNEVH